MLETGYSSVQAPRLDKYKEFLSSYVAEWRMPWHCEHDIPYHFPSVTRFLVDHGCSRIVNSNLRFQVPFAILKEPPLIHLHRAV